MGGGMMMPMAEMAMDGAAMAVAHQCGRRAGRRSETGPRPQVLPRNDVQRALAHHRRRRARVTPADHRRQHHHLAAHRHGELRRRPARLDHEWYPLLPGLLRRHRPARRADSGRRGQHPGDGLQPSRRAPERPARADRRRLVLARGRDGPDARDRRQGRGRDLLHPHREGDRLSPADRPRLRLEAQRRNRAAHRHPAERSGDAGDGQ